MARLWWRDDDAADATSRLNRLLHAAWDAGVPLTLAVVPSGDMARLGARLGRASQVCVAQHGIDHQNRRTGAAAGEFPHDWSRHEVEVALRRGWSLMQGLKGAEAVFVPPWNDVHPELPAALEACSYDGWSAHGTLAEGGLPRLDVHLDLLRWRGGARFRGQGRFLKALTRELARRRRAGLWDAPIGLLTHHLVHDAAAWAFLGAFLTWSVARRELSWAALPDLIREAAAGRIRAAPPLNPRQPDLMVVTAA